MFFSSWLLCQGFAAGALEGTGEQATVQKRKHRTGLTISLKDCDTMRSAVE